MTHPKEPADAGPDASAEARPEPLRVGIVGARVAVQGTGPYVARAFAAAGCEVVGIVGTRPGTVEAARAGLAERFGLSPRGYLALPALLEAEQPDIVAICSPAPTHRALLATAAAARVHVLCEKPLCWDAETATLPRSTLVARTWELVDRFRDANRLLALDTQWPQTLPAYRALHGQAAAGSVLRVDMRLSPISQGLDQVVDAAPHLLSLLFALVGPGAVEEAEAEPVGAGGRTSAEGWRIGFRYVPEAGGVSPVRASLALARCLHQPRPAAYAINGSWAARRVTLPSYAMELVAGETPRPDLPAVPLADPLDAQVADFVAGVGAGRATDIEALVESLALLRDLVRAAAGGAGAHLEQT